MTQLSLFSTPADPAPLREGRGRLDDDSERLLATFRTRRIADRAHPRSVMREVSQLRAVAREAGTPLRPATVRELFTALDQLARVLREPMTAIARSTGRARLLAVQRFIRVMGRQLGRDPDGDLARLDTLLPARRSTGWHTTGTLVAGATGRRRRRGPTLDATDLRRIVDAAGTQDGDQALRDRALVALHCFSGLRPEEIVGLRWEDLDRELTPYGRFGMTASIERQGKRLQLLLPEPAVEAVETLATTLSRPTGALTGPVFHARGAPDRGLSYRAARVVLGNACRRAGLPAVEAAALRAACAYWLRSQGLSDHEVAAVLGLDKVRSVDRLLQRHAALQAQRAVRELLVSENEHEPHCTGLV